MKMIRAAIIFASLLLSPALFSAASAATLVIDSGGILTGASGVNVNGTLYDVTFEDGSCLTLFSGCDEVSDFDFVSVEQASAAAQALLDQVLVGAFDDSPELTFGCTYEEQCRSAIPYGFLEANGQLYAAVAAAFNQAPSSFRNDSLFVGIAERGSDFTRNPVINYARFARSGAVPEPATWAMMILGFGLVGGALRSAKRKQKLAVSFA